MSDIAGKIIEFEMGEMDEAGVIDLFQELVDTGMAWSLQGSYGRMAEAMIAVGLVERRF